MDTTVLIAIITVSACVIAIVLFTLFVSAQARLIRYTGERIFQEIGQPRILGVLRKEAQESVDFETPVVSLSVRLYTQYDLNTQR